MLCFLLCSIYAIGDCIEGPMLAHKAEDEGKSKIKRRLLTLYTHCAQSLH